MTVPAVGVSDRGSGTPRAEVTRLQGWRSARSIAECLTDPVSKRMMVGIVTTTNGSKITPNAGAEQGRRNSSRKQVGFGISLFVPGPAHEGARAGVAVSLPIPVGGWGRRPTELQNYSPASQARAGEAVSSKNIPAHHSDQFAAASCLARNRLSVASRKNRPGRE
jgi:hypothetical protein